MKRIYITLIHLLFIWSAIANNLNNQLWDAIIAGDEQLSIELIKQGADINSLDDKGLALMHRYASAGNEFMIQWLIEHGADVNVLDSEGCTPLMYAVVKGEYRLVYKMLRLGADVNKTNLRNETALSIAGKTGFLRMVALLKNPKSYSEQPTTIELFFQRMEILQSGEWDIAITLAKQEQKQAPKEWAKTSPYYTRGLSDEATIYIELGRYNDAEKVIEKTLKIIKKNIPDSEIYYFNLSNLAFLYSEMSKHEESIKILDECIVNINSFSEPQLIWQLYGNRAREYIYIGNFVLAENDFQIALNYIDKLPEVFKVEAYCITHGNIALMHYIQGTPNMMKQFCSEMEKVLTIMDQYQLYNNKDYIRFKQHLCVYYKDYGYLEKAITEAKQLKNKTKELLGTKNEEYIKALKLLGEIEFERNNYYEAYKNYSEAIDIIVSGGKYSPIAEAEIIDSWADFVDLLLEDSTSLWAYEFVYDKYNEIYGEQSNLTINAINKLGVHYADRKLYEKALPYVRESYRLRRDYYGKNTFNTIINEFNLWQSYAVIPSLRDSAYHYFLDTDKNVRKYLQDIFGILTEQQREEFWMNKLSSRYYVNIPAFLMDYATINPIAYGDIYNNILLTRGLLLNSNDAFSRIIANTQDTILRNKWQQVLSIKTKLNASQSLDIKERHSLEQQKDKLEREIAQASEDFRLAQENFTINWTDIKSALKDDEVAIEFMINSINHWGQFDNKSDSVMYYALVLRNNYEYPQLVPLFERDEVIHFNYYGKYEGMYDFEIHGDSAYNLIWKKIEPYLTDINTIYFAPTHALAQIALEAIPLSEDTIFGDLYSMVRLSSTREILKLKDFDIPQSAILYGGVQYDVTSDEMYMESLRYVDELNNITRSVEPIDTIFRGKLSYLPGTKREVENINELFLQSGSNVVTFTGTAANEESFITLSGKHNDVIHIATHGFFWRQQEAATKDVFKQHHSQDYIDPLSRCGLLFAGANMAFQGCSDQIPEGVQDGILTAREISMLDLSGCDLVVLSACETGVGEYSADGTLGLQRAFKQAGVQSIIMTLWPVSDMAAQFMMTEFYRNWITKGQPKRTAFRNAQNAVRSRFSEPTYWAAFIMLD